MSKGTLCSLGIANTKSFVFSPIRTNAHQEQIASFNMLNFHDRNVFCFSCSSVILLVSLGCTLLSIPSLQLLYKVMPNKKILKTFVNENIVSAIKH